MEAEIKHDEVLVLADEHGTYYVIPYEALEQYRATGEVRTRIEEALSEDVSGYGMADSYLFERIAREMMAERYESAVRERQIHEAERAREADREEKHFTPIVGALMKLPVLGTLALSHR